MYLPGPWSLMCKPCTAPIAQRAMVALDPLTVASTIFTILGVFGLFVSTKPVTLGGVVMTVALAASATQAVVGFQHMLPGSTEPSMPSQVPNTWDDSPKDMVDLARMAWAWASQMYTHGNEL